MKRFLPKDYDEHLETVRINEIGPHSIYLGREVIERFSYDSEKEIFVAQDGAIIRPPIIAMIKRQFMTLDGDHRLFVARHAKKVPAAVYILDKESDAQLIAAWEDENYLRAIAEEAGLPYETARAMSFRPTSPEELRESLGLQRDFVRSRGVRMHDDLASRILETKREVDARHNDEFRLWMASRRS